MTTTQRTLFEAKTTRPSGASLLLALALVAGLSAASAQAIAVGALLEAGAQTAPSVRTIKLRVATTQTRPDAALAPSRGAPEAPAPSIAWAQTDAINPAAPPARLVSLPPPGA